ncbi:hypothetical protein [Endozoicomonas sp. ONNA2]|uniref:hypothetical protein n=1 Tax=Endozoicomonas sp. ONNA2 TaxID=2828741 RepID=UPI0021492FD5|nr:hypothetical protein [Endozoicomonas sp. ONNA2]
MRDFFVAPIKDTFGQIPLDLIEHADFQRLIKKICNVVNTGKEKLQKEIVNIAKEHQENLGGEAAEQPEKTASGKFDSVIKKIRDKLDLPHETDISAALSKNNFEVCSGPINLLHNIKKGEKIQIEFDRFESSKNSPTRLQINSTGRQLAFKDLSEALKVLFKID